MGKTMAEKILARAAGVASVQAGEIVDAKPDCVMTHEPGSLLTTNGMDELGVKDKIAVDHVVIQIGHSVPTLAWRTEMQEAARKLARRINTPWFYDSNHGICHQVLVNEGHALPGHLVIATDSHTTTCGAVGAFACGVGASEMSYLFGFGKLWLKVPESIKVWLTGEFRQGVSIKDMALYLAGKYGTDMAQYKAIEFDGSGARALSMDARLTLCAMSVELGAKAGMVVPDQTTMEFVARVAKMPYAPLMPDQDAVYLQEINFDLGTLEPQVACPHDVGNVVNIKEAVGRKINVASIGTCAHGGYDDIRDAAEILAGKQVNKGVRLFIIPGSVEAYIKGLETKAIEALVKAGAIVSYPSCGLCAGLIGVLADGDTCVAAHNRNFKGRMGSRQAEIFLASPATVAASAITGYITDPRPYIAAAKQRN